VFGQVVEQLRNSDRGMNCQWMEIHRCRKKRGRLSACVRLSGRTFAAYVSDTLENVMNDKDQTATTATLDERLANFDCARETVLKAAERARFVIEMTRRWEDNVDEIGFGQRLQDADELGSDEEVSLAKAKITGEQDLRRLAYTGWRLASCAAIRDLAISMAANQEALTDVDGQLDLGRQYNYRFGHLDVFGKIFDAEGQSHLTWGDTPVSREFCRWRKDITGGRGARALERIYQQCIEGTFAIPDDPIWNPILDDEHHYCSYKPFTVIPMMYNGKEEAAAVLLQARWDDFGQPSEKLIGNEVAALYQRAHELGLYGSWGCYSATARAIAEYWKTVKELIKYLDARVEQLTEDKHRARRGRREKIHWGRLQDEAAVRQMDLKQGSKRAALLEGWQWLKQRIDDLRALQDAARRFIEQHRLARVPSMWHLTGLEEKVAKYNLVAAVILQESLAKMLSQLDREANTKYLPLVRQIEPQMATLAREQMNYFDFLLVVLRTTLSHHGYNDARDSDDPVWRVLGEGLPTEFDAGTRRTVVRARSAA
jgi:hypothetical protein